MNLAPGHNTVTFYGREIIVDKSYTWFYLNVYIYWMCSLLLFFGLYGVKGDFYFAINKHGLYFESYEVYFNRLVLVSVILMAASTASLFLICNTI